MSKTTPEDLNSAIDALYKALDGVTMCVHNSEWMTTFGKIEIHDMIKSQLAGTDRMYGWLCSVQQHRDTHLLCWPMVQKQDGGESDGA